MAVIDTGSNTAGKSNVDAQFNLRVNTPGSNATGAEVGGGSASGPAIFAESDPGTITLSRLVLSPEVDHDFRFRAPETLLDQESFNYTAQNTGKHTLTSATLVPTFGASGYQTNSTNLGTTGSGSRLRTYATFPAYTSGVSYVEVIAHILGSGAPANANVNFGLFLESGVTPFTPTDGAYFSFTGAGLQGVCVSNSGTPQSFPIAFTPVLGQRYKFVLASSAKRVDFWIDDVLYLIINRGTGLAGPYLATSLPLVIAHANTGAATPSNFVVASYQVSMGGLGVVSDLGDQGNRAWGSHQGLGGSTQGSLSLTPVNAVVAVGSVPSGATPQTTGLGGTPPLNATAAAATDLLLCSYTVPASTVAVQGRRIPIYGVRIATANMGAAVATTDTVLRYDFVWGHTAVSLATTETAASKAPRRETLGFQSWAVGAGIGAPSREGPLQVTLSRAVYANPGEQIAISAKVLVGTATVGQFIAHAIIFDYGQS